MTSDTCTCGRIKVGNEVTELRNWNPDCAEHGTDSAWWNSPEQVAKRQENHNLLQIKARAARDLGRGCHGRPVEALEPIGECDVCDLARQRLDADL